jgi:hypothetical protein
VQVMWVDDSASPRRAAKQFVMEVCRARDIDQADRGEAAVAMTLRLRLRVVLARRYDQRRGYAATLFCKDVVSAACGPRVHDFGAYTGAREVGEQPRIWKAQNIAGTQQYELGIQCGQDIDVVLSERLDVLHFPVVCNPVWQHYEAGFIAYAVDGHIALAIGREGISLRML